MSVSKTGPPGLMTSVDTESKARARHPSRRGGPRRPPDPPPRLTPLALSALCGIIAASAVLWIIVFAVIFSLIASCLELQARIAEALAVAAATTSTCEDYPAGEDPGGPAGGRWEPAPSAAPAGRPAA